MVQHGRQEESDLSEEKNPAEEKDPIAENGRTLWKNQAVGKIKTTKVADSEKEAMTGKKEKERKATEWNDGKMEYWEALFHYSNIPRFNF